MKRELLRCFRSSFHSLPTVAGSADHTGKVALGTWSVRLHSRAVVRPGCVLLGDVALYIYILV
jgi:hypothetical protein